MLVNYAGMFFKEPQKAFRFTIHLRLIGLFTPPTTFSPKAENLLKNTIPSHDEQKRAFEIEFYLRAIGEAGLALSSSGENPSLGKVERQLFCT